MGSEGSKEAAKDRALLVPITAVSSVVFWEFTPKITEALGLEISDRIASMLGVTAAAAIVLVAAELELAKDRATKKI